MNIDDILDEIARIEQLKASAQRIKAKKLSSVVIL